MRKIQRITRVRGLTLDEYVEEMMIYVKPNCSLCYLYGVRR